MESSHGFRTIAAAGALLFLAGCARGPQHYIDSGNKYFEQKRYAEAALSYRNAIQKDASSAEAHYRFGLSQIAQDDMRAAATTLGTALRLQPNHRGALASLGDIYLRILLSEERRPKQLAERLSQIAGKLLTEDPNSYDGLRFRGHLSGFDGKWQAARDYFVRADRIRPEQPQLQLALADAMAKDNSPGEAERMVISLIDKNKAFGPAYDFLQLHYLRGRRFAEAERIVVRKAENNPEVVDFQLQLAGYYIVARQPAEAQRVLARLQNDLKKFPEAHLRIGDFYLQLGKNEEAQRHYEEGLRVDGAHAADYKKRIARHYWTANRKDEALKIAADLVEAAPLDDEALRMRAAFLLEEGKPENLDWVINEYSGQAARMPRDAKIPYQLGRAYLLKGQAEQAKTQFGEAVKKNPLYLAPRLALAEMAASQARYEEALRHLDQILGFDTTNTAVRLLRAGTLRNLRRYSEARSELARLPAAAREDINAQVELGLLNLAEGRLEEAEATFLKLYRSHPAERRAVAGLVRVYSAQGRHAKAIQLMNEELKKDPGSESVRQALTAVALNAGDRSLALENLRQIVLVNPKNAEAYVQIGQIELSEGKLDSGLAALRKALDLAPRDSNVAIALAAGLEQAGRTEEAKAAYRQLLVWDKQNLIAFNNLAYLLAQSGQDLDQALLMASTASQREPANLNFRDTLGMVYLKKNMVGNALGIFRSLAAAEPHNTTFRIHLGVGLLQKGDRPSAKREFLAALSSRHSPEQGRRLRQLLVDAGEAR